MHRRDVWAVDDLVDLSAVKALGLYTQHYVLVPVVIMIEGGALG
jgi:hypothetical protein